MFEGPLTSLIQLTKRDFELTVEKSSLKTHINMIYIPLILSYNTKQSINGVSQWNIHLFEDLRLRSATSSSLVTKHPYSYPKR